MTRTGRWFIGTVLAASLLAGAGDPGAARAAWPGYPGRIAFYGADAIQTVQADGSDLKSFGGLTYSLGGPNGFVWSTDGRVAYALAAGDGHTDQNIHVYGEGTLEDWGATDLGTAFSPAWSPDGSHIMFICSKDPATPGSTVPTGICETTASGGSLKTVVAGTFGALAWSPNGDWIAYSDGSHVHLARSNGSDAETVPGGTLIQLEWSPDSTTLIGKGSEGSIWELNPFTDSRTRVADQGAAPAWSPDGSHIVYETSLGSHNGLTVAAADGSDAHLLPNISGSWPRWLTGVRPNPPAVAGRPTITGTAKVGSTLTASTGTWNGDPPLTFGYQWQRCDTNGGSCTAIASASSSAYVVAKADVGSTLRVDVSATNRTGTASSGSDATGVVIAAHSPPRIAKAHARWAKHALRFALTVCDDSSVVVVAHLGRLAHSWTIGGSAGCRNATESWAVSRRSRHEIVTLSARDAFGAASAPVRMTLR